MFKIKWWPHTARTGRGYDKQKLVLDVIFGMRRKRSTQMLEASSLEAIRNGYLFRKGTRDQWSNGYGK